MAGVSTIPNTPFGDIVPGKVIHYWNICTKFVEILGDTLVIN